jgi:hypothetical protein
MWLDWRGINGIDNAKATEDRLQNVYSAIGHIMYN